MAQGRPIIYVSLNYVCLIHLHTPLKHLSHVNFRTVAAKSFWLPGIP